MIKFIAGYILGLITGFIVLAYLVAGKDDQKVSKRQ
jgi:hypothetical protein